MSNVKRVHRSKNAILYPLPWAGCSYHLGKHLTWCHKAPPMPVVIHYHQRWGGIMAMLSMGTLEGAPFTHKRWVGRSQVMQLFGVEQQGVRGGVERRPNWWQLSPLVPDLQVRLCNLTRRPSLLHQLNSKLALSPWRVLQLPGYHRWQW